MVIMEVKKKKPNTSECSNKSDNTVEFPAPAVLFFIH